MFEGQVLLTDDQSLKLAKHIVGMAALIRWVNSFPEYNVQVASEADRVFSEHLSGFFAISKDDATNTLYLGVQEEEAKWLKLLPFHSACLDLQRKQLGLLCDGVAIGYKQINPINIIIQISDKWKLEQLSHLRRVVLVGVVAQNGEVVNVLDQSQWIVPLLHQSVSSAARLHTVEKLRNTNVLSQLFD